MRTVRNKRKKRDYKREYAIYHGKPEQIKRRAQRNKTRRNAVKLGQVRKGDGKDVDHKDNNVYNQAPSNLQVMSASANRSKK
jgi:hypothetical protein